MPTGKAEIQELEHGTDELRVKITNTLSGRDFIFAVHAHRIDVQPELNLGENESKRQQIDWYHQLTLQERVDVLKAITTLYREESKGVNGIKAAAIYTLERKESYITKRERHPLFIGVNSAATASDYDKVCAEQMALNVIDDTLDQEARRGRIVNESSYRPISLAQMTGSAKVPIACSCGKCTDMQAKRMDNEAEIIVYPVSESITSARINQTAKSMAGLKPGQTWVTDMETLNSLRTIDLDKVSKENGDVHDYAQIQRDGLLKMIQRIRYRHVVKDESFTDDDYRRHLQNAIRLLDKKTNQALGEEEAHEHATYRAIFDNHQNRRRSVAQLNAAVSGGVINAKVLDMYMHQQIEDNLFERMEAAHDANQIDIRHDSNDRLLAWCREHIQTIRCIALQFKNDRFYAATEVQSMMDNAYPPAGVMALGAAMPDLARSGVVHIFASEMNPKQIEEGRLITPPKQELERTYKRRAEGAPPMFTAMLFNDQEFTRAQIVDFANEFTYTMHDIYGGAFAGGEHLIRLFREAAQSQESARGGRKA